MKLFVAVFLAATMAVAMANDSQSGETDAVSRVEALLDQVVSEQEHESSHTSSSEGVPPHGLGDGIESQHPDVFVNPVAISDKNELRECMDKHKHSGGSCGDKQLKDACQECDFVESCVFNVLEGCSGEPTTAPHPHASASAESHHQLSTETHGRSPLARSCYINKECPNKDEKCVHGSCQNAPEHMQDSYFYAVDVNEEGLFHTELRKVLSAISQSDDLKPVSKDQIIPEDNLHMTVAHLGLADADAITELAAKINEREHAGFLLRPTQFVVSTSKTGQARTIRTIFEIVDDHHKDEENNFQKIRRGILKLVNLESTLNSERVSASGHVTTIRFENEAAKESSHTPEEAQRIADALNEALQHDDSKMRAISIPVTRIELLKSVKRGGKKVYEHVEGMDITLKAPHVETFDRDAVRDKESEHPANKAMKAWELHNAHVPPMERVEESAPVVKKHPHPLPHKSALEKEADKLWEEAGRQDKREAPGHADHGVAELAEEPAMGDWVPYTVSLRGKN